MTDFFIDAHSSTAPENLQRAIAAALQQNRVDFKALYATPHQAELWRQVALKHSPVHRDPEFRRIYDDAFTWLASELPAAPRLDLIGLGCGTGEKEARLHAHLRAPGREISFSAIDVSRALVEESAERLATAGAHVRRSLVCDLGEITAIREWLSRVSSAPRIITFFGLIPQFLPAEFRALLRTLVRPGDILLASAHLAADMRRILPQYDNPETHAWLAAGIEFCGLADCVEAPEFIIDSIEETPAFIARAKWKTPDPRPPLHVFHSIRHTPDSFERLVKSTGLTPERLALTACREEGIWSIRNA